MNNADAVGTKLKALCAALAQAADEHDKYAIMSNDSMRTITWAEMHREIAHALRKVLELP